MKHSCEVIDLMLQDYIEGTLNVVDKAMVDAHLDGCNGCLTALQLYKSMMQDLNTLETPDMPEDLHNAIMTTIYEAGAPNLPSSKNKKLIFYVKAFGSVAAVMLVMILALAVFGPHLLPTKSSDMAYPEDAGSDIRSSSEASTGSMDVEMGIMGTESAPSIMEESSEDIRIMDTEAYADEDAVYYENAETEWMDDMNEVLETEKLQMGMTWTAEVVTDADSIPKAASHVILWALVILTGLAGGTAIIIHVLNRNKK